MLNLGNTAYVTESSQHCFLGAQTGKHLLRKQNGSFVSRKQKTFPQQMFRLRANGEIFRETCFLNKVCSLAEAFKVKDFPPK